MPHGDINQTLRNVLHILRQLQTRRSVSRQDLVDELQRSERTIRRYLNTLMSAGFDLDTDEDGNLTGRIRLRPDRDHDLPLEMISLTRQELILLYLQLSGIQQVGDAEMRSALMEKVRNAMGGEQIDFRQLTEMLLSHERAFKSYDSPGMRAIISDLLEALYWSGVCELRYQTPADDQPRDYVVEPYRLLEFDGGLYCCCHVTATGQTRLFAVERICWLERRESWFERIPEVEKSIDRHLSDAFRIIDDGETLRVRLRFRKDQVPYVAERVWHPSQRLQKHRDGSATLQFEASGRFEIVRWILGWGDACRVIAPTVLKTEVSELLDSALVQYSD